MTSAEYIALMGLLASIIKIVQNQKVAGEIDVPTQVAMNNAVDAVRASLPEPPKPHEIVE